MVGSIELGMLDPEELGTDGRDEDELLVLAAVAVWVASRPPSVKDLICSPRRMK